MTPSWVSRPLRSTARSWPARARAWPSSAARPASWPARNGGILSPEKSSSRTTAGRPASRLSTGSSAARCSVSAGQLVALRNGISVRSRPTPAAPAARPRRVSVLDATLHSRVISWPSAVRTSPAGSDAALRPAGRAALARLLPPAAPDLAPGSWARSRGAGSTTRRPPTPSRMAGCPAGAASTAGSAPASMGTPSPRAMIAACELAPPVTDTAPASPVSASRIRSAGSTSRRTRMKSPGGGGGAWSPASLASTARATWRTSSARAARSGWASAAIAAAWAAADRSTATAASAPSLVAATAGSTSAGSAAISAPIMTISASSPRPLARR